MTTPIEQTDLEHEALIALSNQIDRALGAGLSKATLASLLLELSKEAAMRGDLATLYRHFSAIAARGEALVAEFEGRFGAALDLDALARGEIVAKG